MTENKQKVDTKMNLHLFPPDLQLRILTLLDHSDRLNLSLVSKLFQPLVDAFIHKLKFNRALSNSQFWKIFLRFKSVTQIIIDFEYHIGRALIAIARSTLKIQMLDISGVASYPKSHQMIALAGRFGNVKVLKLAPFIIGMDSKVVDFITLFPSLEELDLSHCSAWRDVGIQKLASNIEHLQNISLDYNKHLSDCSLDALSKFVSLEHISIDGCIGITLQGFCLFLLKMKNLRSLKVPLYLDLFMQKNDIPTLAGTISLCENLRHLSTNRVLSTDAALSVIANSRSPLTSLELKLPTCGNDYTMKGLSAMLCAFQGLTKLHTCLPWSGVDAYQDKKMSELVKSLPCLKDVYLFSQTAAYATLFSLIESCPVLESICMKSLRSNTYCDAHQHERKNHSIQRIQLSPKPDSLLKMVIISLCPSLKCFR